MRCTKQAGTTTVELPLLPRTLLRLLGGICCRWCYYVLQIVYFNTSIIIWIGLVAGKKPQEPPANTLFSSSRQRRLDPNTHI